MQPVLPDSTDITPLLWHAIGIREVTSTFLTLWPRLSTWTPTSPLVDADESLARFAAEHGHPVVVKFLEDQATATKTVKEFLRFLSGKSIEVGDETQTVLEIAMTSQFPDVKTWAQSYGTLQPRKGCFKSSVSAPRICRVGCCPAMCVRVCACASVCACACADACRCCPLPIR